MTSIPVITIDGPAGSGKGTLCRLLAQHLAWNMLDSGATYRLLALAAERAKLNLQDETALANLNLSLYICFDLHIQGELKVYLDKEDVSLALRTEECGKLASQLSAFPAVRLAMLDKQRAFAQAPGLVTDGRDMGTIVFPDANLKLFLIASAEERAKRRYKQLKTQGVDVSIDQILEELLARDERDQNRKTAPLKPASDAIILDSSTLPIEAVFEQAKILVAEAREKRSF